MNFLKKLFTFYDKIKQKVRKSNIILSETMMLIIKRVLRKQAILKIKQEAVSK